MPPDNYSTRLDEDTKSKTPLGQHVAEESKGEDKPHAPVHHTSWRKRNPTSQSLPHDLSSPTSLGNLTGCDTGPGLQEGGCGLSGC